MAGSTIWSDPVQLINPDSDLTEDIGYFTGTRAPLFGVYHHAGRPASLGVVIVPPFLMEFQRNYRREVLLARSLAVAGVPALRFAYGGQGHSGGDTADLGFDAAVDDTAAAIERLRSVSGVEQIVLIGTRMGGLVAAQVAAGAGVRHVAIADPVVTGAAWLRELSRAERVQAMQAGDSSTMSLSEQLAANGKSDVLGSAIFPSLYEEAADRVLVDMLTDATRGVLLIQFGQPTKINKRLQTAADVLIDRGVDVRVHAVSEEEGWWASRRADYFESETDRALTTELLPLLVNWVGELT